MASTALTQFLPEVLPTVVGCSDIAALNAVRNAAIEFCSSSLYWQSTLDPETLVDADFPYTLAATANAQVASVLSVRVDGLGIDPITRDLLDRQYPNWDTLTATVPTHYYQDSPDVLALFPRLQLTNSLVLRVAYTPLRTATTIETYVYENYLEEIAAGALSRLLVIPGTPWSNAELAKFYNAAFMQGIVQADIEAKKSYSNAPLCVLMRPLA